MCTFVGVCAWLAFALWDKGQTSLIVCPSKLLLHIPCPGCGMTRATVLFLKGHVVEAVMLNPNVLIAVAYLVLCPILLVCDAFTRKQWAWQAFRRFDAVMRNKWVFALFCVFEAGVWVHNYVCGI